MVVMHSIIVGPFVRAGVLVAVKWGGYISYIRNIITSSGAFYARQYCTHTVFYTVLILIYAALKHSTIHN